MKLHSRYKAITFIIFLAYVNSIQTENLKEKHISALVSAKWTETPFLLETSEFIFRNNPNSFWRFANEISTNSKHFSDPDSINNQSYYEELLNKASKYVSPMQFDLLKLSLSIRAFSPAIEMSRKLAEDALTSSNSKCLTFVDLHGQITCNPNEIITLMKDVDLSKKPFAYQFDKHYEFNSPTKESDRIILILYSQIGTQDFIKFHEKILKLSESNDLKYSIDYILRHNYKTSSDDSKKVALSGYGVELDIKSTEYKAKDDTKVNAQESDTIKKNTNDDEELQGFLFNKLKQSNPHLKEKLEEYKKYLLESTLELAPLKAWQMQDLSLQAAQRIIDSDPNDALNVLEDLSQNFPIRARTLSKIQVRKDLRKAFKSQRGTIEGQLNLEIGSGALFLNGLDLGIDHVDIFTLNSVLKKEAKLIESLNQIGLSTEQIRDLVYLDVSSKSTDYGVDLRDSSIQWLNDLESDKKYSYWSKSVNDILRPTYPGMLRSIAKNFFNLVFVLDPSKEASKSLLKTAESFYVNDIPVRIGFVFVTNNDEQTDGNKEANVALFRAHNYLKLKTNSAPKALAFITDIYAKSPKNSDITSEMVIKEFKKRYPKEKDVEDIFGPDSDYDEGRKLTMEYYNKIGLKQLPQVFVNGFPLSESEFEADVFEESVLTKVMQITSEIQMAVYKGQLYDSMNLLDWLMSKDVIMPRLNPRILSQDRQYLAINELEQISQNILNNLKYISNDNEKLHPFTLWLVCDPDTENGRQFLYDALNFYESAKVNTRLSILMRKSTDSNDLIKKSIMYSLNNLNKKQSFTLIKRLIREKTFNDLKTGKVTLSQIEFKDLQVDSDLESKIINFDLSNILNEHDNLLKTYTSFKNSNQMGLLANGWILGPFDQDETFIDSDFNLLENFILKIGLKQVNDLLNKWDLTNFNGKNIDDTIVKLNMIVGKYSSTEKRIKVPEFTSGVVNIKPKNINQPFYDIIVVLDPLSRHAQKISTILKSLTQVTNVNLLIYFNCKEKLSASPLKSFYRYVLDSEVKFNDGNLVKPFAYFHSMPQSPILTMNIHSPESWMVEAVRSPYDLDNICLKEIDTDGAFGEFELEHLIIEGHAFDILSGQSPRGLQFNLGTVADPNIYDTIVMANLGYFQLKASPGMWILKLREGRSKDIYEVVSHENTDSESKRSSTINIAIDSFEAKVIRVKVSKKADKINENLLDDKDGEKEGSIWDSLNSFVGSSSVEESHKKENVLNIFSVASGHLYERLMRIMMLTVLKNTQAKVKFWFLKNYLSPQFTRFLPYYAKQYGFDYELVQYKWPRWLHRESEKQRTIWGYKILFLDVLFPLNVEKIIYVDADQIVKADLTELRDMDLKGAPYGYTPFCDSRKEMEGYRFWKTGYWQMHLGHRKYHISALYVVDLKKFRKIAAGDRLRGQYQGLSQDPNSLSNLDQDLPNNMIHQVNIFSLPQEWLYCDTWCSSDTLAKAKTIDLCNNPQTKEPKLDAAVRIVPEWKDYDNEIKNVMQTWLTEQKQNQTSPVISSSTSSSRTKQEKEDL